MTDMMSVSTDEFGRTRYASYRDGKLIAVWYKEKPGLDLAKKRRIGKRPMLDQQTDRD